MVECSIDHYIIYIQAIYSIRYQGMACKDIWEIKNQVCQLFMDYKNKYGAL